MTKAEILLAAYSCIDADPTMDDDGNCDVCPLAHLEKCRYFLKLTLANIFFRSGADNLTDYKEKE